jgi:hypothetical protein
MGLDYIVSRGSNETRDFDAIVDFLKEELLRGKKLENVRTFTKDFIW